MTTKEGDALAFGLDESPGAKVRRASLARQQRAHSHQQSGQIHPAHHTYEHAAETERGQIDQTQRFLERACVSADHGQYSLAVPLLVRFLNKNENHAAAWHRLGFCYGELGRHARAIECFNRAIELAPTWGTSWANRGWNRLRLRDCHGALQDLINAVELDPDSAPAWANLGQTYSKLGVSDKAAEAHEQAGNLNPHFGRPRSLSDLLKSPAQSQTVTPEKPIASVNMARIIKRESPRADAGDARWQTSLARLWSLIQNPVAWIVIFVIAALLYTLLGN